MKELAISDACWRVGLSLPPMGDKGKATEEFLVVRDTDRMGKYCNLAQKQLESLEYASTTAHALV